MSDLTPVERRRLRRRHSRGRWRLTDADKWQDICHECSYFHPHDITRDRVDAYPCDVHRALDQLERMIAETGITP